MRSSAEILTTATWTLLSRLPLANWTTPSLFVRMPSGPSGPISRPATGAGNVLCGADPGKPISRVTDSFVVVFSHVQPLLCTVFVVDFPGTVPPSSDEMSCGDTIEHAFSGFEAGVASVPGDPPDALPGALCD
jgi:hypothetical protein